MEKQYRNERETEAQIMKSLAPLFGEYSSIVVLDTETSGLDFRSDRVIELAVYAVDRGGRTREYDTFVSLPEGTLLDDRITELTNITQEQLNELGISPEEAAADLYEFLKEPGTLVCAHNAQFDLSFIYYNFILNMEEKYLEALRNAKFLDTLTVYRDRRPYPHTLAAAVEEFSLNAQNTHRAVDDAMAALELVCALTEEKDDLLKYVNLFGYSPKYGVQDRRISSVVYRPQTGENFRKKKPLYETAED